MQVKGVIFEDFVNYKKASMTIMMPKCDFKCNREANKIVCQNFHLRNQELINVDPKSLFDDYYVDNDIIESLVIQGLEPFDSFDDLCDIVEAFASKSGDDIVIYTGYNEDEIGDKIRKLQDIIKDHNVLVIKFGRYIPNDISKYDPVLGVTLASQNQYGKVISTS